MHLQSAMARLAEGDVEFLSNLPGADQSLSRQLTVIGAAEQLIVLDQSPLPREIAQALLLRKHARPGLKVLVLTDPAGTEFGSTQQLDLLTLERSGVIVVRLRLDSLRDSNLLYSPLWRLGVAWWADEAQDGQDSWLSAARRLNFKADARQVLLADDGSGQWVSVIGHADSGLSILLRAAPVQDMIRSELSLAQWSSDDDRLPVAPPSVERRVGTLDTRFVTEGAIAQGLLDELAGAQPGDDIWIAARALSERRLVRALKQAAAKHATVRVLLDPSDIPNSASADELVHAGVELRWHVQGTWRTQYFLRRHAAGFDACIGTASFSRRGLDDFNLNNGVEMHMPLHSAAAHSLSQLFIGAWARATPYGMYARESTLHYWQYRLSEALGLGGF
jgi:PLD-like domain